MSYETALRVPEAMIDVLDRAGRPRVGHSGLVLGRDVEFSTAGLESYAFAKWEPVVYDALVISAAVEYADRIARRPPRGWTRRFLLRIPVHEPKRWNDPRVFNALKKAVEILTGDYWLFTFVRRSTDAPVPSGSYLSLAVKTQAVLPYSDGLDSRAVAGIMGASLKDALVRVRVGSKRWDRREAPRHREPFTQVPYSVKCNMPHREVSSRSRGFKFATISSIAAYLTGAKKIIIPESGQGALGPSLVPVGHGYSDLRNHPRFTIEMENYTHALLGRPIPFVYPRLWTTKGETLKAFITSIPTADWSSTRSCWRNNRWCSINGKLRQCGICAACMLRRLSIHSANLFEPSDTYVADNLNTKTLEEALNPDFKRNTRAFKEYAIAGVLHMDHLADMASPEMQNAVQRHATFIAPALGLSVDAALKKLNLLLQKHANEWASFLKSLRPASFVHQWIPQR